VIYVSTIVHKGKKNGKRDAKTYRKRGNAKKDCTSPTLRLNPSSVMKRDQHKLKHNEEKQKKGLEKTQELHGTVPKGELPYRKEITIQLEKSKEAAKGGGEGSVGIFPSARSEPSKVVRKVFKKS